MAQDITIRFRGDTRSLDRALKGVNRSLDRLERNAKQVEEHFKELKPQVVKYPEH